MPISLICQHCGISYLVRPYRANTSKCCSKKCLWHITRLLREPERLKSVTGKIACNNAGMKKICGRCGTEFQLPPTKISKRKYCSSKCTYKLAKRSKPIYKRIIINGIRVPEHRHIMQEHLGRKLMPDEDVHHINFDHLDNRLENLIVLTKAEHAKLHHTGKSW